MNIYIYIYVCLCWDGERSSLIFFNVTMHSKHLARCKICCKGLVSNTHTATRYLEACVYDSELSSLILVPVNVDCSSDQVLIVNDVVKGRIGSYLRILGQVIRFRYSDHQQ